MAIAPPVLLSLFCLNRNILSNFYAFGWKDLSSWKRWEFTHTYTFSVFNLFVMLLGVIWSAWKVKRHIQKHIFVSLFQCYRWKHRKFAPKTFWGFGFLGKLFPNASWFNTQYSPCFKFEFQEGQMRVSWVSKDSNTMLARIRFKYHCQQSLLMSDLLWSTNSSKGSPSLVGCGCGPDSVLIRTQEESE